MRSLIVVGLVAGLGWWWFKSPAVSPPSTPNASLINPQRPTTDRRPSSVATAIAPSMAAPAVAGINPGEELGSVAAFRQKLDALDQCVEGGCAYPETDPRSYDFALNDDITATLVKMNTLVKSERIENSEAVSEVARHYVTSSNEKVQDAALALIASQPPSRDNLGAILEGIFQGASPDLIKQGMSELQRYHDPVDVETINQGLASSMTTGSPFVAEQVSSQLGPFIQSANVAFYRNVADQLPPESIYRDNVLAALANFAK